MGEKRKRSSQSSEIEASVSEKEAAQDKKVRVGSELPSTPQPLTEENLALLEQVGPESARSSTTQPSTEENLALLEETMALKDAETQNLALARTILELNRHFMDDKAIEDNPIILKTALKLIKQERKSGMSEQEKQGVLKAGKRAQVVNEDTFIDEVWSLMLRNGRNRMNPEKDQELNGKKPSFQLWTEDHLGRNRNQLMHTDCVPTLYTTDKPGLNECLQSLPKLTNPKPDLTYGLLEEAFTQEQLLVNVAHRAYTYISPTLYHVFFVMEFKSNSGNIEECRQQACRDGATAVNAMRQFKIVIGENEKNPADPTQSMAYSLVVDPNLAELYVHWVHVKPGAKGEQDVISYHMNMVKRYLMGDADSVDNIRHDVDNILDWGLLERKNYVLDHLARIQVWQAKKPVPKPTNTPRKKRCLTTTAEESTDQVQADENEG